MKSAPQQRLRAESIAPRALRWLAQTQQAHVMYAFERVINLVNQEGEVLSIAHHLLGNGPFTVVLEPGDFLSGVAIEANLLVFENGLWVDEWLIDAEDAKLWQPTPNWGAISASIETSKWASQIISQLLNEHAEPDSLARLVLDPGANSPLPARIIQAAEQLIPMLLSGIRNSENAALVKASKGLAGIGPGLTPAGDDLLLGVMHGLWATRSAYQAAGISSQIAKAAVPRTHTLSAAWLEAGAAGEAAEPWHRLIIAMGQKEDTDLRSAVMDILPTGHTSGSDALGGFLAVLTSLSRQSLTNPINSIK